MHGDYDLAAFTVERSINIKRFASVGFSVRTHRAGGNRLSIHCIPRGNARLNEGKRVPVRALHTGNFGTGQLLGLLDSLKFNVFRNPSSMDKLNFGNVSKNDLVRNKITCALPR